MKQKRILLVDHDEEQRLSLKMLFDYEGYEVSVANGGRVAQSLVESQQFDVVVTDLQMPEGSGVELLDFMRANKIAAPVIVLAAPADQDGVKAALERGANEILPKPVSKEDLMETIEACTGENRAALARCAADAEYCGFGIDDFVSGGALVADLFIRLSDSKFVKIAAAGDSVLPEQLARFREKNIQKLYMRKDDFRRYIGMNVAIAREISAEGSISRLRRLKFLRHTGELIIEQIKRHDLDEEGFEQAKTVLEATVSIFCDENDSHELLQRLRSHSNRLYAHGLAVGLYSVMVARQMGWLSPSLLFRVAAGGLFHDIGLKDLDPLLLAKSRHLMTPVEAKAFESHPERGFEALKALRSVPGEVLQIVAQHHENCAGSGYPAGLTKSHLYPMARVVGIVDAFCELALDGPAGPGIDPKRAIQRLLDTRNLTPEATQVLRGLGRLFSGARSSHKQAAVAQ